MAEKDIPPTLAKTMRLTKAQWEELKDYSQELKVSQSKVLQLTVGLGLRGLKTALKHLTNGVLDNDK